MTTRASEDVQSCQQKSSAGRGAAAASISAQPQLHSRAAAHQVAGTAQAFWGKRGPTSTLAWCLLRCAPRHVQAVITLLPARPLRRPTFTPKVFGFKTANTDEASDGKTMFLLERCYRAFDFNDRGQFDWRIFLLMYRVVSMPLVSGHAFLFVRSTASSSSLNPDFSP